MTLMGPAVSVSSLVLAFAELLFVGFFPTTVAAEPCCPITSIDTRASVVTAQDPASRRTFQFTVKDSLLLFTLKVGQRIDADFNAKTVSIESGKVCCDIVSVSTAAPIRPAMPRPAIGPMPPSAAPALPATAPGASQPASAGAPTVVTLPKVFVATGPPVRTVLRRTDAWESRRLSTTVDGKAANFEVLHLRGLKGIEAAELPESVKQILLAHARTLSPDEAAHYTVNKKMVEEWARTHPMPEALKDKKKKGGGGKCHSISTHCVEEAAKHAEKEVEKQADALRDQARHEWTHLSREVGRDLKMTEGELLKCFADHRISSGPRRIPSLKVPLNARVAGPLATGKDYKVYGSANVDLPIRLDDVVVEIEAFVIPCAFAVSAFPVWVRPRSVSFQGTLSVDSTVAMELHGTGAFRKSIPLKVPGNWQIVEFVVPIGEVPVEVDLAMEFHGVVEMEANGVLDAKFCDVRERKVQLEFACDGKGCTGKQASIRGEREPVHDFQLAAHGFAKIRPAVFTALRLEIDGGALAVRAGPEFYVSAEVQGGARAASSGPRAASAVATAGLSADLFGGVDMRFLVDFVRPAFAGAKSGLKSEELPRVAVTKERIGPRIQVATPAPAAQPTQAAPAPARCGK